MEGISNKTTNRSNFKAPMKSNGLEYPGRIATKAGFAHIVPLDDVFRSLLGYSHNLSRNFEKLDDVWSAVALFGGKALRKGRKLLGAEKKEIDLRLSDWEPVQGDTLAIFVSVPPPQQLIEKFLLAIRKKQPLEEPLVQVSFGGRVFPVFPASKAELVWRTLIPTTPLSNSGPCPLTVKVNDGRHERLEGVVVVCPKAYPVESIWLSATKSKIRGTEKEKEQVRALTARQSPVQYWCRPFTVPSHGEVTTAYGVQRYYNDKFAEGYYHRGVDYGADEGTPVIAPSSGMVVLVGKEAEGFEIHGNCVGLDHGHGVTSILMHLSSILVKEGDIVEMGQTVGHVGETGIATGPHLHWGLYVHGEAVDPHPWMTTQF